MSINEEDFERAMGYLEMRDMVLTVKGCRARDTAQREALARVEAERDEAIKLLGWSKYQLMLWEDYQVENGFEVEDHYVTGKVREEVEAFLAGHAQVSEVHGDSHRPAREQLEEAVGLLREAEWSVGTQNWQEKLAAFLARQAQAATSGEKK